MTSKQIAEIISSAIVLEQTISNLQEELAFLKGKLLHEAEMELRKVPCPPDLAGCGFTFKDDIGQVALVSFPKPRLISNFWLFKGDAFRMKGKEVVQLGDITGLADAAFKKLFSTLYKPAKAFRELAPVLLGHPKGTRLVELMQEPSSPRVTFQVKESMKVEV